MPRNDITLSSKIALLDKIKSQPLNTSYRRLAEITGVPKSTISRLYDKKVNCVRNRYYKKDKQEHSKENARWKDPDMEEALDQWFPIVSGKGVNINGPTLKTKPEELAKKLGRNDF
ncbi:Tigger transposable element-derived protein 4 [Thelohanellus kitauei]|uniref:Tigger transposable element-derived protein 4 n=1 Tax=Thelohanellus kitauei TaxID=669202 RepID=A0A0C2N635_THEKT|nr:Tigger transposable element-derived protein 4 [Thelohanellus kitauei]